MSSNPLYLRPQRLESAGLPTIPVGGRLSEIFHVRSPIRMPALGNVLECAKEMRELAHLVEIGLRGLRHISNLAGRQGDGVFDRIGTRVPACRIHQPGDAVAMVGMDERPEFQECGARIIRPHPEHPRRLR